MIEAGCSEGMGETVVDSDLDRMLLEESGDEYEWM